MDLYGVDKKTCDMFSRMAFDHSITVLARLALGEGLSRADVAEALKGVAFAIEKPGEVAENMSAIDPEA
jgi:hypothetical protein